MNNEQQELLDEVYENYKKEILRQRKIQREKVQKLRSQGKRLKVSLIELLTKEDFIDKCKTDSKFSEKWGLTIEERELSLEERAKLYEQKTNVDTNFFPVLRETLNFHNIPTRLITITYHDKTIKSYE
jgi:hypothetical protein